MRHRLFLEGFGYRLRPVTRQDAKFIVQVRTSDMDRNRFIHKTSTDIISQEEWLDRYFERPGDYYFIVENRVSGLPEGLIAFYNQQNGGAEWGRWVLLPGSLAAIESVYLLYRIAFEQVGLNELYCRTIAENKSVVSFHSSIGEITRQSESISVELNGKEFEVVEQYSSKEHFYRDIAPRLESQSKQIFSRNKKRLLGTIEFHHIGVAVKNISKELSRYALLGYICDGEEFVDEAQGIRGLFIVADSQPRLELLENLDGSNTLKKQIESGNRMYHTAYYVENIEKWIAYICANRGKVISPMKQSAYFGKRICFIMLPNMAMIELIEK